MAWKRKTNLRGPRGHGVKTARITPQGHLVLTLTDQTELDAGLVRGAQGIPGMNGAPTDAAVAGLLGGASLSKDAVEALAWAVSQQSQFNVVKFGAVKGADVDIRPALQSALDAAAAAGGGVVVVPPGHYGYAGVVRFPGSNITIQAYGVTFHRIGSAGDFLQNWAAGDKTTPGYEGNSNLVLLGFTLDHHGDTYTGESNVITFNHCRNVIVRDVWMLRTKGFHALELNGVDGFVVDNCNFLGYLAGTQSGKEAIQIDCALNPTDSGAADETVTKNGTIRHCYFGPFGAMGAHTIGIGSHSHATSERYSNITVDDCTFDRMLTRAIVAYWWQDSKISRCNAALLPGSQGIRVMASIRVVVESPTITGPGAFGITFGEGCLNCEAKGGSITGTNEGVYDGVGNVNTTVNGVKTHQTASYSVTIDGSTDAFVTAVIASSPGYPSGAASAIRFTGGAVRPGATGNKAIPHGVPGGTEVAAGVSVHASVVDAWVFGNDFKGLAAATVGPVNTTSNRT